ncbi:MAG: glycosyltransferase [Pseudomonadota bacterium]
MSHESEPELTILMPCLNEAETLATCIQKAQKYLRESGVSGEVLIADNGSDDGSQDIALENGARVEPIAAKGYGNALIGGIQAARGKYVIMADADDSYDFYNLGPFVEGLRKGHDLVMGNRFKGGIAPGAMPPLHRYLGNPVLSFLGRLFFSIKTGDFHCGLRGFNRQKVLDLNLVSGGMEFASEMVVKASLNDYDIVEVPTTLSPDGRSRPPHLRSWRDGWRHLKFLLIYSPKWLFLYPGILLFVAGGAALIALVQSPVSLFGVTFNVHTMLYSAAAVIIGFQFIGFALFSRILGTELKLLPENPQVSRFRRQFSFEKLLVIGLIVFILGLIWAVSSVMSWRAAEFGGMDPSQLMRQVIPAVVLIICGIQIALSSVFTGVIDFFSGARR